MNSSGVTYVFLYMSCDSRLDALVRRVASAARTAYRELGWGWREDVYREALARELAPLRVACEVAQPVLYKGYPLPHVSVRWDMLVDDAVLVELKAVKARLPASAVRQMQRYRQSCPHTYRALVINFPDRPDACVEIDDLRSA